MERNSEAGQTVAWQQSADLLPEQSWDVLVLGAGPAGATAALHLARRGYRVLLLDRQRFPRDKTCGDLLIADALQALERAGLDHHLEELGHPLSILRVFSPSRLQFDVPGRYFTLRRRVFDTFLAEQAVAAGAVFAHGHIDRLDRAGDGVRCTLTGSLRTFRGRLAVVATGASVDLLPKLGLPVRRQPDALAARCYVRSPARLEQLVVSFDHAIVPGYAWIFPLGNDEYNVGCGFFAHSRGQGTTNLRAIFQRFTQEFPPAVEVMRACQAMTPLAGARLRCGLHGAFVDPAGRILAVGETIGATYPLTGEGIGKAMRTAELAAESIHEALTSGDPRCLRAFPGRLERELRRRYRGYQRAENWLSRPWVNDLLARRVQRSATLQETVAGILNEAVDPNAVFSLRGLLRWVAGS